MHVQYDLNRFTAFENMQYLMYDLMNALRLIVVI